MIKLVEADFTLHQQQILAIRTQVFIIEQGVPEELEVDDFDPLSRHLLLFESSLPVATGRLTPDGHIGRIAVLKNYRRKGYASQIIAKLEALASHTGLHQVKLAAQLQALPFYEKLSYQSIGAVFMDAGIEHQLMQKLLD
jgi:predicted GNAT family N-acyltransferase